jgi:predicted HD phosphohydrolase
METASFNRMSESTADDWQLIMHEQIEFVTKLPDRILAHLDLLRGDYGGFPIDRMEHCLQTANLAAEAGEDDEYIVCALLHDIGDTLGSTNHPDVAAAILQPFISEANLWMVKHHGIFQGYNFFHYVGLDRNMRDKFSDSEHFDRTARFVENYDNPAFDASAPKLDIALFEPMVRKVFSEIKHSIYKDAMKG